MSEPKDKSSKRIERLLRVWGAEQAVAQEQGDLGHPPAAAPTPRPQPALLAPLMAAAGILLCGIGVAFYVASLNRPDNHLPPVVAAATQPDEAATKLRVANSALAADLADLKRQLADRGDAAGRLALENGKLAVQLADAQQRFKAAQTEHDHSVAKIADLESVVQKLQDETCTIRDDSVQTAATLADRRTQIEKLTSQLQSRRQLMIGEFQDVYLGGQATMAARQQSARRNRLIKRFPEIRKAVKDENLAKLADALEVWLTRLDQVDTRTATAVSGLARLAGAENLADKIDKALLAGTHPAEVKTWLLECELVFLGIGGAT